MRLFLSALAGAAVAFGGAAHAGKNDLPALTQPMKFGDQAMNCTQIVDEVGAMETRLGGSPAQSLMDGEQMAGVGTGLAQRAAISAGAGGGAVGAIGQVGGLLGKKSKKKKQREAEQRALAEKRWLYLVGLYQGKSCDAQIAQSAPAAVEPAAEAVEQAPEVETETTE